ncbi:MAG: ABC transporter permease [Verrucomicrobia bacterium]|nr:ABC transporter permease [Verrucomicrobiota bacterium]
MFSLWGARALLALKPFGSGTLDLDTSLDWRVLGFTSAIALATGIVFGLAPALRATRLNLTAEFQGGARTLGAGSRSALAKSLMVVQVALSLVLLVGAGLFVRTLRNLQNVDVGFNREQLLLFQINAAANGATGPQSLALYERMRTRFTTLPGVNRVSFGRMPTLSQNNWTSGVMVPGYVQTERYDSIRLNGAGPDYLATLGIPLLRGRDFTDRDVHGAPKVAIVNQAFAKKYLGSEEEVIGRRFSTDRKATTPDIEIVGLMRDAQYSHVKTPPPAVAFFPYAQLNPDNAGMGHFILRYQGGEAALITALRAAAREIDATLPITNIRTQQEQLDRLFTQERLFATLCSLFGGLALVLSAIGLYGLMSYAVHRRTGEIGLRMALGALPQNVLSMVVRESLVLVLVGVAVGVAASLGATRTIASLLFGLSGTDPLTYGLVALGLIAVALFAALLPARRASRIDPMQALRTE